MLIKLRCDMPEPTFIIVMLNVTANWDGIYII